MMPLMRRASFVIVVALMVAGLAQAAPRIENTVTITDPKQPVLRVTTSITGLSQPELELGIPTWAPGYYITEDFARNISRLVFTDQAGRVLHHEKNHPSLWRLDTRGASTVKITFEYGANELDLNKSIIRPNFGILNGSNFFFYIKGHTLDVPASVTFKLPVGWSITTGLAPTSDPTTFTAESYDVLADCPVLVGEFDQTELPLRGVPHRLAVVPKGTFNKTELESLASDYLKVMDAGDRMFGEIPYKQYLVITVFEGAQGVYGALEHSNSYFGIMPEPEDLKIARDDLVGLTAHEFFHAFNVKRIRPAELWPYRYDERSYTPLLWFSEGVTDYYTSRGKLRAGLINEEQYLQEVTDVVTEVEQVEAAKYISAEEASVNAWIGGITGSRQPFRVDYYSRGNVLGLLLDLSIRHDTRNAHTLDDVMRLLYQNYYKKNRGFKTSDLVLEINRLTGRDYNSFFKRYIGGTDPLPFNETFAHAGLKLEEVKTKVPRLGVSTSNQRIILSFTEGSVMEAAGAKVGDTFLSVGPISTDDPRWVDKFRSTYAGKEGETVAIKVIRDGKPLLLDLKIKLMEISNWKLQRLPTSTPEQKELLARWVSGK